MVQPRRARSQSPLIVISSLQEVDRLVTDAVHQAMLLCDPARQVPGKHKLKRFGFPRTCERVSHDGVHQIRNPHGNGTLVLYPEPEVLKELRLEHGDPFRASLHRVSLRAVTPAFRV
jgi:hypothetical protein